MKQTRKEITKEIKEILADFGPSDMARNLGQYEVPAIELGMDSMDRVDFAQRIEKRYDILFSDDEIEHIGDMELTEIVEAVMKLREMKGNNQ